jgi:hypothetical protein
LGHFKGDFCRVERSVCFSTRQGIRLDGKPEIVIDVMMELVDQLLDRFTGA